MSDQRMHGGHRRVPQPYGDAPRRAQGDYRHKDARRGRDRDNSLDDEPYRENREHYPPPHEEQPPRERNPEDRYIKRKAPPPEERYSERSNPPLSDDRYSERSDPRYSERSDTRYSERSDPRYSERSDPRYSERSDPRYSERFEPPPGDKMANSRYHDDYHDEPIRPINRHDNARVEKYPYHRITALICSIVSIIISLCYIALAVMSLVLRVYVESLVPFIGFATCIVQAGFGIHSSRKKAKKRMTVVTVIATAAAVILWAVFGAFAYWAGKYVGDPGYQFSYKRLDLGYIGVAGSCVTVVALVSAMIQVWIACGVTCCAEARRDHEERRDFEEKRDYDVKRDFDEKRGSQHLETHVVKDTEI